MSATLQISPSIALGINEVSLDPLLHPHARPLHWLDIARPVYRFFAHPLTMVLVWGAVYFLSTLISLGWLMVVLL